MKTILQVVMAGLATAAVGCSSSNGATTGTTADGGIMGSDCKDPFAVGMSATDKQGNTYELMQSAPVVPSVGVSGGNTWTIKVTMASPPTDGTEPDFTVYCNMPMHTHGCGGTGPRVKSLGNGQYEVSSLIFIMPGQWYVNIMPKGAEPSDAARFGVCLE